MTFKPTSDYYRCVRNYPRTMKLVSRYVAMGLGIDNLAQEKLDEIYSEYIFEKESAFTDLFWLYEPLKMSVQEFLKRPDAKNSRKFLEILSKTNRAEQYQYIEELFKETEKHFNLSAANEYAEEKMLDDRDRALAMQRGC